MRISYWSSDVCSSDLTGPERRGYQRGSGHSLVLPLRQLVWAEQTVLPAAGAECVDGFVHPIEAGQQWREPAPALSLGPRAEDRREIGRASCRERVCPYVSIAGGAGS